MKMRWVVTFKDDGSLKARLVVQGFYRPKTRQDSNVFSNRIPSISSDFPDTCRITWFSNSQRRRNVHFFRETWTSNMRTTTTMTLPKLSQRNQFPIRSVNQSPELSRKLQLEHHQCIRLLKAVYGLVNAPRRWYQCVATKLEYLKFRLPISLATRSPCAL